MSLATMHGMDTDAHSFEVKYGNTAIRLKKGSVYKSDGEVDTLVVGWNEQRTLTEPDLGDWCGLDVGKTFFSQKNKVYVRGKETESASDDDTRKLFGSGRKLWKKAEEKTLQSKILTVVEPRIFVDKNNYYSNGKLTYSYYVAIDENTYETKRCFEKDAIEQSCIALANCYNTALFAVSQENNNIPNQAKIAFPELGRPVGVCGELLSKMVWNDIFAFIDNNPEAFGLIELYVKKRSDFVAYKKCLEEEVKHKG